MKPRIPEYRDTQMATVKLLRKKMITERQELSPASL